MQSKKVLYRKGVAPLGADNNEDSSSSEEEQNDNDRKIEDSKAVEANMIDKRLLRLQSAIQKKLPDNATNNSKITEKEAEEVFDEEPDRRARIRARALEARRAGRIEKEASVYDNSELPTREATVNEIGNESMSESDDSSDSEDDEQYPKRILFKPVFVSKNARDTVTVKDQIVLKEMQDMEEKAKKENQRKLEATDLVLETLRREAAEAELHIGFFDLDDTDGLDEEHEMAAWKIRELLRIKRDREEREYRLVDEQDIERRRKMSDSQIESENIQDGRLGVEKTKLKFMQKYYHKGAFYAGDEAVEDALRRTDSSAPTLEDHQDKLVLPDIMKVKNFGKSGRTKYTHLVDQDTTGLDTAWAKTENLSQSVLKKMGGMKAGFSKPSVKKRRTE